VKRFAYILSRDIRFIEAAKFFSDRYSLLTEIIKVDLVKVSDNLIPIQLDTAKIDSMLKALIEERKNKPLDIPDYKGRFTDEEIFVEKNLYGKVLKLCNTGFDNQIIFLANLLEREQSEMPKARPAYIFLAESHKELREYLQANASPS
jgi:hypothetical protein